MAARVAAAAIRAAAAASASGAAGGGIRGAASGPGSSLAPSSGGGCRAFATFSMNKGHEVLTAARGGGNPRSFSTLLAKWKTWNNRNKGHPKELSNKTMPESALGLKISELETELKFERAFAKLRIEMESKFAVLKLDQEKLGFKFAGVEQRFKMFEGEVEQKLKMFEQRKTAFIDKCNNQVALAQYNVWKSLVRVLVTAGGCYLTYNRISEMSNRTGEIARPPIDEYLMKDWFE